MQPEYQIKTEAELEARLGTPMEFVRAKIQTRIDDAMRQFVERSPLVLVSTMDSDGLLDVSPKGDPAGFIQITSEGDLLIPERPGNRLAMGFRNILANGRIGLLFVVPNQRETLRVKGIATLHTDPDLLEGMTVNGKPALMYTRVKVSACFVHCGKAMIRSKLWQPDSWGDNKVSLGARAFAALGGELTSERVQETERRLDQSYKDALY
ncbi:MSMEG_1061 family FMN-dependent PPOX-type flavoprotein [Halioxenophilus sp. WMMB6]|uniref:MSMEG_1061 family FMN-dependent PPOX-type flavoprotein n=1 Tax=Halioxenophilus sp. WMMB6 TaxID=3073815 RepID=UPI00295EEF3A|nr:MSMEG_1061 family FMN-dependent PPOX-type flavoprotein [Halioxenophilus sp. WMMB6]